METIALLLLYALSQKPDFSESVKPLFGNLKNTEELLKFLNDLRKFSDFFAAFKQPPPNSKTDAPQQCETPNAPPPSAKPQTSQTPSAPTPEPTEKPPTPKQQPSPTSGIANDYIEKCLEAYFKKR